MGLLDEVCGQIIFELVIVVIILALVDMGMSESQAHDTVFVLAIFLISVIILREMRRRKALGKAVELDTDGDGRISEEEWAAAGMVNENEEVGGAEKDWWGSNDQEE